MTMARRDTTTAISELPVVIYDGTCDFCRQRVCRWQAEAGDRIGFVSSVEVEKLLPGIQHLRLNESVHLIEPSGCVHRGARAVLRIRKIAAGRSGLLWLYENVPGFRSLAEYVYRIVARHRRLLGRAQVSKT